MRLPRANAAGRPARLALLALVLWPALLTPATAGQAPPVSQAERSPAATEPASRSPCAAAASRGLHPAVFAGFLGDRQRMVQVAMIFMGLAILILVRGNRF